MSSKPPVFSPQESPSILGYLFRSMMEPQLQLWLDSQEPTRIIQQLEENLADKDTTIETQETAIEAQKKTFEESLANKNKTIRAHETTIESLKKTLQENSANKDTVIKAHEATIEALKKNIATLTAEIKQQADMKKSLDDLQTGIHKRLDESQINTENNHKHQMGYIRAIDSNIKSQGEVADLSIDSITQILANQVLAGAPYFPKEVDDPKAAAESSPKMLHQFQNSTANTSNSSIKMPSPNGPTEAPPKPSPSKP